MKALFITPGPLHVASTRMRAVWVARHMPADATAIGNLKNVAANTRQGSLIGREQPAVAGELRAVEGLDDYGAYIFVKAVDLELVQRFREQGKQVWWDVCDPAWWFNPKDCREIADQVTGVVASNDGLAQNFRDWYGKPDLPGFGERPFVHVVPDRLDLEHFPKQRWHVQASPVRFIWFGGAQNRIALFAALANLERLVANGHDISLTVCDDQPGQQWEVTDAFPWHYVRWSLEHENAILADHDIALLPPYPGPWGKVKSNNKTLTAWACGLPVTDGQDYGELAWLAENPNERGNVAQKGLLEIERCYTVQRSAAEWLHLLEWGTP